MNEFEEAQEYENLPEEFGGPSKRAKITKKILRIVGWILFCSVLSVLMWRMCSNSNDPKSVSTIMVNDKLANIYSVQKDSMEIYYQNLDKFNRDEESYGYFAITQSIIIPEAEQVQIVFRYNISTLEYLAKDFPSDFPEVPDRNEDLFDVTLVKVVDLTPENTEDNDNKDNLRFERYFSTDSVSDQTSRHNYTRLLFEDISCEDALTAYVCIYYKGDLNYENAPLGNIPIYTSDKDQIRCKYILTSDDKKAFAK